MRCTSCTSVVKMPASSLCNSSSSSVNREAPQLTREAFDPDGSARIDSSVSEVDVPRTRSRATRIYFHIYPLAALTIGADESRESATGQINLAGLGSRNHPARSASFVLTILNRSMCLTCFAMSALAWPG
jgi:hypothetical protein